MAHMGKAAHQLLRSGYKKSDNYYTVRRENTLQNGERILPKIQLDTTLRKHIANIIN